VGDSAADAIVREIREESGFETRATKLLALWDRDRDNHPPQVDHFYKVFIRCEILGGSAATSHEIQAVAFFAENEIPPLSLTRNAPAQSPGCSSTARALPRPAGEFRLSAGAWCSAR
jgi:ADP-ribose pyrophosphatase YjhB (NUDIX family)